MIKKVGEEWCVFDSSGTKKLGCHDTEEKAKAQLAAIEANKNHSYASGNKIEGVEIFATGKHNGDEYTEADLDAMIEAFGELDYAPPLKAGHVKDQPGMPALGWVANLRKAGGKLIADFVDMPDLVYNAVKDKLYNTVSSEIYWDFERAGKKFKRALKAVALLGADIPAVANLKPLHEMFTDANAEVKYGGDIPATYEVALSEPPTQQLSSKENEMNEDDVKRIVSESVATAVAAALASQKPTEVKPLTSDEKAQRIAELTEAHNKAEAARKTAADALAAAQAEAGQNAERIKALEEEHRKVKIEGLVETCRIPGLRSFIRQYADLASREADVHVYDAAGNKKPAMSELEQFIGYINANAQRLFSVVSIEDVNRKSEVNPADEVDRRIQQYKSTHPNATHHEAMHAVLDADPVLKADYAQAG